jgi:CRISPR-associated protein Csd1
MLKSLYDYAVRHQLTLPPGFVKKPVKAYIVLNAAGKFLGLEPIVGSAIPCPDIGSMANSTDKCHVLAEKRSLVLSVEDNAKSAFFRDTLAAGAAAEPLLAVCLQALNDETVCDSIIAEADKQKIKPNDRISFRVNGCSILESQAAADWWLEFRRQFKQSDTASRAPCLITGQPTIPASTVPPINGLLDVGGHARGDSLICFDKPAFCSYGLKQGANAPVSEDAFASIKSALDELLTEAPILAGMKFVHWFDKPVPDKKDSLAGIFSGYISEELEAAAAVDPGNGNDIISSGAATGQADALICSVPEGQIALRLDNQYYILLLTGVGGRVMIRSYQRGSYEQLQKNINLWWRDISLLNDYGTAPFKPRKLVGMLIRLLPPRKKGKSIFDRLNKELPGISPAVLNSILNDTMLSEAVAARALTYIRSMMLNSDEDRKTPPLPDGTACQWLKAYLLRHERKQGLEESLMTEYNPHHPRNAYHCGALLALYAAIQNAAMPDVNTGIIQRFYASAIQTPALVIGRLSQLANHHLAKIEEFKVIRYYEKRLNEVYASIGHEIPKTLDLEEQSYFALGYRQYALKLYSNRNKKSAQEQQQPTEAELKNEEDQ